VEVQEAERRYIARELHDEIGQLLTGLKLTLDMCVRSPADEVGTNLDEAREVVNELITRGRELSLVLRPSMLDDLGLLHALLWHLERYTTQTGIRVSFKHTGLEGRFASEVETAAYRIVQEALTNVARHADVDEVTVRLWVDQDTLSVQIEDQGTGFEPEIALTASASSGLSGMQERAVLLGGHLTVESAPGAGTRLTAELPLGDSAEERGREG
nr:histidine kinase [Anaerolineae bacterium]NIQ82060.1 histidine kinase [Anaerolineae bacterium]